MAQFEIGQATPPRAFSASFVILILVAGAVAVSTAMASVSLRNGNYFVGYTDLSYPGGFEPKVERVYNSKTPFKGIFGWGWGNEYEVHLTVSADGSVLAHEYGGGAQNRFSPVGFSPGELAKAADLIVAEAQKAGIFGSATDKEKYRKRLEGDASFRNEEWEKWRAQGRLKARQLTAGTQLVSTRFSYQHITKTQDGYIRTFDTGKVERFDEAGRLVKLTDKNGNFLNLTYGKDGRLQKILDNFNRKMFFTFNAQGLVEKIEGENGKKTEYKYNPLGELIHSRDADGNTYTYQYSADKHHNLTEIGYADRTTQKISYWARDKFENVKSVKDRDGTVTEYEYLPDASNKNRLTVNVKVKSADGTPVSTSRYEYFVKRKADGEEWTEKLITEIDGDRTETTYGELGNLPVLIKRGKEETRFEYTSKGQISKKTTPNEITELSYDAKVNKVNRVVRRSKSDPKRVSWSTFQYDSKGNLLKAQNSDKKTVSLIYDGNGRIRSLIDQNRRQISFKYNENSKPVEISDPSIGTITVQYSNSGEIKKVDSPAGRRIAFQVTSAFQNLLDIIRPAGVSLSF